MTKEEWDIDWDYWKVQLEGYKQLRTKKKIWRDYKNETKELIDAVYDWWWIDELVEFY